LRRLAHYRRRNVHRSWHGRRSVFRGPLPGGVRRSRLVGVAARQSDLRPRNVRHVFPCGGRPLRGRMEGGRRAGGGASVRHVRIAAAVGRGPRRQQPRTTSWRGSYS
jgi:hypothetical protein